MGFCHERFWDFNLTTHDVRPDFTPCFHHTVLVYIPCAFFWLFVRFYATLFWTHRNDRLCLSLKFPLFSARVIVAVALAVIQIANLLNIAQHGARPSGEWLASLIFIGTFALETCATFVHHQEGHARSFIQLFFWLILMVFQVPTLVSAIQVFYMHDSGQVYELSRAGIQFVFFSFILSGLILQFFSEASNTENTLGSSELNASAPSLLLFTWLNPLIWSGFKTPLLKSSVPDLGQDLQVQTITGKFNRHFTVDRVNIRRLGQRNGAYSSTGSEHKVDSEADIGNADVVTVDLETCLVQTDKPQIERALIKAFGKRFFQSVLLKVLQDVLKFIAPQILKNLIRFAQSTNDPEQGVWKGYFWACLLFSVNLVQILVLQQYWKQCYHAGMEMKTATVTAIYKKSLRLSNSARRQYTLGQILNLMASDASTIEEVLPRLNMVWSMPFQIILAVFFLYQELGPSVFSGVVILLILIPFNMVTSRYDRKFQSAYMKVKDQRIRSMYEILSNIKIIKFNTWEEAFADKVLSLRTHELKFLKKKATLQAFINFVFGSAPILVTLASFATYVSVSSSHHLTAEKNITVCVPQGCLVAVVGQVGSGKSTLLAAILGEAERLEGEVCVNGSTIAYVSQEAWIQNASVKNNIIFAKDKPDHQWYKQVIEACSLEQDLHQLMDGDQTLIGEKGINLSGGQKQRIAIARAAYSSADIFLLDDPLSALDSQTASHVFEQVLSNNGILRHSTRVLATHNTSILSQADLVAVLKDGEVAKFGPPGKVMTSSLEISRLVKSLEEEEQNKSKPEEDQKEDTNKFDKLKKPSAKDKKETALAQRLKDEDVLTGRVKGQAYQKYLRALGIPLCVLILGLFMANQAISTGTTIWLAAWSDHNSHVLSDSEANVNSSSSLKREPANGLYIGVLGAFGGAQAVLSFLRNLVFFLACARGSKIIHNSLFGVIIRAKTRFFDITPTGSIMNRFAADLNVVDQPLPNALSSFLFTFMEVTSVLIVISITTPIFMIIIVPLVLVYTFLIRVYIPSSRQLQRYVSSTKSPINLHFSETIQGISTIRAFQHEKIFNDEFESRVQEYLRFQYTSAMATRWLSLRSEALGNIVVLVAALVAVAQRNILTAGWVGLSITYALSVTETFNWVLQNGSKLEEQAVNLERIRETEEHAPLERPWQKPSADPKDRRWVKKGDIEFRNLTLAYDEHLEPVLKGINLSIKSGEKVGVCGRTGAGKSSLAVALLNLVDSWSGQMFLDGIDVRPLGLHSLRSQITMIPQDPVMFKGTIRQNIDPFNKFKDDAIWDSLANCHMDTHIERFSAGLEHQVEEGGSNFSVGQKQLICLARALLKDNTIVFLDEATASMDAETDKTIQETLFRELEGKTLITIAHRLNTVLNYDKILVLDEGQVVEFDTPQHLLSDENSHFYAMIHQSKGSLE
ncbi:hypothetical protein TCAL_05131 [Tigriopus californicus]|uniref:ABC-type glutathione-S-conjugate transporter n=1 Tax=Tigriopus californicus TaxID=6832 RepID=A0A553PNQ9_TIGCA|nr:hypothetical protein TCAL_05131 [Tigriopus californicus]